MQHHNQVEQEGGVWIYTDSPDLSIPEKVRRVKIAEGITEIPDEAFNGHQELEEVIFSSLVQVIGKSAFNGCNKLKFILVSQSPDDADAEEKQAVGIFPSSVKVIDDFAFCKCKLLLGRLVLNEGLEQVGKGAFYECKSLTEVDFPSSVKVIDIGAFFKCELLGRLGLKEGLERIEEAAFCYCESLTEVDFPSTVKAIDNN
eukprot:scaffold2534_cov48-Cylindrotheca_fusiformis.AAC.1